MSGDMTCLWVYGKVQPGWYCARWLWNESDAKRWTALGYRVMRSQNKPEDLP